MVPNARARGEMALARELTVKRAGRADVTRLVMDGTKAAARWKRDDDAIRTIMAFGEGFMIIFWRPFVVCWLISSQWEIRNQYTVLYVRYKQSRSRVGLAGWLLCGI